jgi:predicted O-linked N-acetylglucosamine transferase (SPINDLY family)
MNTSASTEWDQTKSQALPLAQAGRLVEARRILEEFCHGTQAGPEAWFLLGAVEGQLGRIDESIAACKNAIEFQPDYADAHYNLAQAYVHREEYSAAVEHYRTVLRARPDDAVLLGNLSYVLEKIGELGEASACARRALELRPDDPELLVNLGNALRGQKQSVEAEECYRRAIAVHSRNVTALINLGALLRGEARDEEALAVVREAVEIAPNDGKALLALAGMLIASRANREEGLSCAQRAVQAMPNDARAHSLLGRALERNHRLDDAILSLQTARRLDPKDDKTLQTLADVLFALSRHREAIEALRTILDREPDNKGARTSLLFYLSHICDDGELLLREHREWAERHVVSAPPRSHSNDPDPDRVLRVGYVSGDLKAHPVAFFFEPILANHDPSRVHVICYSGVSKPDGYTDRLRKLAHDWRDIHVMGDEELVALVERDRVDILVDLSGHTGGNRLTAFALRPAPVLMTYIGYANTTGLSEIHYRITDSIADPEGSDRYYTEQLLRLSGGFCCYVPPRDAPDVWLSPPAAARGYVTFGSLNKPQRLTDDVVALWARVLRAVPRSRLFIGRAELQGDVAETLARRFVQHGIRRERVEVNATTVGAQSHLSLYSRFDIALDTFPWSGHTTSCEALWMGVPVVTLYGKSHAGRMVASVLHQIGLESLVARTPDEYVRVAQTLARDVGALAEMRRTMRDRMLSSPLCDGKAFTVSLEQAYREVWKRWCATQRRA